MEAYPVPSADERYRLDPYVRLSVAEEIAFGRRQRLTAVPLPGPADGPPIEIETGAPNTFVRMASVAPKFIETAATTLQIGANFLPLILPKIEN